MKVEVKKSAIFNPISIEFENEIELEKFKNIMSRYLRMMKLSMALRGQSTDMGDFHFLRELMRGILRATK